MTFSYDGSNYNGYQKQPNKNTIQDVLEGILTKINSNRNVCVVASGRTDSGVHAINQKAHFDLNNIIDCEKLKHSINKMLPSDIYVKNIINVDKNFHARFNKKKKTYTYIINSGEYNPIEAKYIYQINKKLDVDSMKKAIKFFIGKHDFTSYTVSSEEKESYVRTIFDASINVKGNLVYITFIGDGFLRYMVRNMVGSLIEVGIKKIKIIDIQKILNARDRRNAGITAPSCGLYLMDIIYE